MPKPITNIDDPRYVKALAHPLRVRVLAMLEEQAASPVMLAGRLPDATLGSVAYHVRALNELGLVKLVKTRQRRGATEHIYKATEHPRFTDEAWAALGPVAKQRMISAALQQIGEYAHGSAAAGGFDRADAHFSRTAMRLDEEAWAKLAEITKDWLRQVADVEEEARQRIVATDQHPAIDVGLVIMLFEALPFSQRTPRDNGSVTPKRRLRRSFHADPHADAVTVD